MGGRTATALLACISVGMLQSRYLIVYACVACIGCDDDEEDVDDDDLITNRSDGGFVHTRESLVLLLLGS